MLKIEQVLRNENGDNVLGEYFDTITIKASHILVKKGKFFGLYNLKTYEKVLDCEWEKIVVDRQYIIVTRYNKIAVFDSIGNNILEWNWDKVVLYDKGILVSKNNVQGFYSYEGNPILECTWKKIEPYRKVLIAYIGNGAKRIQFYYNGEVKQN